MTDKSHPEEPASVTRARTAIVVTNDFQAEAIQYIDALRAAYEAQKTEIAALLADQVKLEHIALHHQDARALDERRAAELEAALKPFAALKPVVDRYQTMPGGWRFVAEQSSTGSNIEINWEHVLVACEALKE